MGADPPDKSDLTTVSTDNIDVTGVVDGGLQFSVSAGELDVTGDGIYAYIDFQFGFHVAILDPLYKIKDNSLAIESAGLLNIADDLGMFILEDIFDAAGNLLGTKDVEFSDLAPDPVLFDLTDSATFDPQSEIWVTKNILVWATDPGETASLQSFSQRFSQMPIPEPSTWLLMGLGLAGLMGVGRKVAVRA